MNCTFLVSLLRLLCFYVYSVPYILQFLYITACLSYSENAKSPYSLGTRAVTVRFMRRHNNSERWPTVSRELKPRKTRVLNPRHQGFVSLKETNIKRIPKMSIKQSYISRVSGYRYRGLGFDFRRYQIFWVVVGLERGPLSLVRSIEELLE